MRYAILEGYYMVEQRFKYWSGRIRDYTVILIIHGYDISY